MRTYSPTVNSNSAFINAVHDHELLLGYRLLWVLHVLAWLGNLVN